MGQVSANSELVWGQQLGSCYFVWLNWRVNIGMCYSVSFVSFICTTEDREWSIYDFVTFVFIVLNLSFYENGCFWLFRFFFLLREADSIIDADVSPDQFKLNAATFFEYISKCTKMIQPVTDLKLSDRYRCELGNKMFVKACKRVWICEFPFTHSTKLSCLLHEVITIITFRLNNWTEMKVRQHLWLVTMKDNEG